MDSALAAIIMFTLGIFAFVTITQTQLAAQDALWMADQARQERMVRQSRTALTAVSGTTQSNGSLIEMTLRNSGAVKLADFQRWDVVVQYYTEDEELQIAWLPYTAGSLNNMQWTVAGIYHSAGQPEVFEPDILNPGEEIVIRAKVLPPVGPNTVNRITVTAPNGMTVSAPFTRN